MKDEAYQVPRKSRRPKYGAISHILGVPSQELARSMIQDAVFMVV